MVNESTRLALVFAAMVGAYVIGRLHGRASALRSLRTIAALRAEAAESMAYADKGVGPADELLAARQLAKMRDDTASWFEDEIRDELRRR
jgi:enoyl-CoA hydratase/carnithine racemase